MRKQYLLGMIFVLLGVTLAGCGPVDEKTRLKEAMVDVACNVLKPFSDQTKNINASDEAAMAALETASKDMESKMNGILTKHGFKDQAEVEAVSKKYKDDKTLEADAKAIMVPKNRTV